MVLRVEKRQNKQRRAEEAEFFIEYANKRDLALLKEGRYHLPDWKEKEEGFKRGEEIDEDDD